MSYKCDQKKAKNKLRKIKKCKSKNQHTIATWTIIPMPKHKMTKITADANENEDKNE